MKGQQIGLDIKDSTMAGQRVVGDNKAGSKGTIV
jgi:hypothetical protein